MVLLVTGVVLFYSDQRIVVVQRGDVWTVDLDPTVGREKMGPRPVVVVSPGWFNGRTGTPIVLPVTTGGAFARQRDLTVSLDNAGTKTTGVISCDQPRVVDLAVRNGKHRESVPEPIMDEVFALLATVYSDSRQQIDEVQQGVAVVQQGEVWTVDIGPTVGREEKGTRPVVVLSPGWFNGRTGVPVVLPVTRDGGCVREQGFAVSLDEAGTETTGVIRCDQPRALDLDVRNGERVESVPEPIMDEVLALLVRILPWTTAKAQ